MKQDIKNQCLIQGFAEEEGFSTTPHLISNTPIFKPLQMQISAGKPAIHRSDTVLTPGSAKKSIGYVLILLFQLPYSIFKILDFFVYLYDFLNQRFNMV